MEDHGCPSEAADALLRLGLAAHCLMMLASTRDEDDEDDEDKEDEHEHENEDSKKEVKVSDEDEDEDSTSKGGSSSIVVMADSINLRRRLLAFLEGQTPRGVGSVEDLHELYLEEGFVAAVESAPSDQLPPPLKRRLIAAARAHRRRRRRRSRDTEELEEGHYWLEKRQGEEETEAALGEVD